MADIETKGHRYTWDNFVEEPEYKELKEFFGMLETQKDCCVIFVSRKAYCLFLLLKKKGMISFDGMTVYTDRLIIKKQDLSKYAGEKVLLVDDTISTGENLTVVCREVAERTNYKCISACVFMKDEGFEEEAFKDNLKLIEKKFDKQIEFCPHISVLTKKRIRFSAIETLLFHESCIPYAVELPFLGEVLRDGEEKQMSDAEEIVLTSEEYNFLQQENAKWRFVKCDQYGYLQDKIESAVIIMKEGDFSNILPEFVHEFVVRVQIEKGEEGEIKAVFLPFAIFKSIKYEELETFFFYIYEGTEYEKRMTEEKERLGDKFADYYYKALYRAIVYVYSYYVGYKFKDYLKIVTGKEYDFQNKNNKYCFDEDFMISVKQIFCEGTKEFFLKTFLYKGFADVECRSNIGIYITKYGRISSDYTGIYYYLWTMFNELRRTEGDDKRKRKFLSLEELQESISVSSMEDMRNGIMKDTVTACLCAMLEQSRIANEVIFDKSRKIVYRGFKYAENGEVTFDLQEKIFYIAVFTYAEKFKKIQEQEEFVKEQYEKNYNRFLMRLKEFLIDQNLLETVVSLEVFWIYAEYYRKYDANMLMRLKFLLENKKPIYVARVEEYISALEF